MPTTEATGPAEDFSVVHLTAVVLRYRNTIVRWALAVGVLTFALASLRGRRWTAESSFTRRGMDAGQSSLRSLAGQFGFQLPGAAQGPSLRLFEQMLVTHAILGPVAQDTFVVPEREGRRLTLMDLFEVDAPTPAARVDKMVRELARDVIRTRVDKESGVISLSVTTRWPSVSLAVSQRLLRGLNDFNLASSREQASEERSFTEGRLAAARTALVESEDRLLRFLQSNRQFQTPELRFENDRRERDVAFNQQLVTTLAQAYEEGRIREARDTPVITMLERPRFPERPNPRGRVMLALVGAMLGALATTAITFLRDVFRRQAERGDPAAVEIGQLVAETKAQGMRWLQARRKP